MRDLRSTHLAALALSMVPVLPTAWTRRMGDLPHYHRSVQRLWAGEVPWVDFAFEYPPWALLAFLPTGWVADVRTFSILFGVFLGLVDLGMKAVLLQVGARIASGARSLLPFAAFTLMGWAQAFWYLKRFDLLPAAGVLIGLVALGSQRPGLAGFGLGWAAAIKLYPAVLLPLAAVRSGVLGRVRPFAVGIAVALAPMAVLAPFWPWWHFGDLHAARGLQVESLPASALWLAQHLGWLEAAWVSAPASYEVQGDAAAALLSPWKILWVLVTLASAAVGMIAVRRSGRDRPDEIAEAALPALLSFVAFSPVLSPQYLIWLSGPAALTLLRPNRRAALLIVAATLITPLVYPSPTYATGLDLTRTLALVARNGLLLGAWACSLAVIARAWPTRRGAVAGASA